MDQFAFLSRTLDKHRHHQRRPDAPREKVMSIIQDAPVAKTKPQGRSKPFTSTEYIDSLRDGREIWIYGERVKDVTVHPAFRNTIRMLARLYDALHDQRKSTLCAETDTGSGG